MLITSPFVTTECINIQDELYGWCCIGPRYLNKVNPVFVDFFHKILGLLFLLKHFLTFSLLNTMFYSCDIFNMQN